MIFNRLFEMEYEILCAYEYDCFYSYSDAYRHCFKTAKEMAWLFIMNSMNDSLAFDLSMNGDETHYFEFQCCGNPVMDNGYVCCGNYEPK